MLHSSQSSTSRSGQVATIVTMLSLATMLVGIILGSNSSVRNAAFKFLGSASGSKVRLTSPLSIRERDSYSLINSSLCFSGVRQPASIGRYFVHTSRNADGSFVAASIQYTPPGKNLPECNSPTAKAWDFTIRINKNDLPALCQNGLFLSLSNAYLVQEPINFVGQTLETLCQQTTSFVAAPIIPTITPTPALPSGSCPFRAITYLKEQTVGLSGGEINDMEEIGRDKLNWYAMNNKQRERFGASFRPVSAETNTFGFTNGEIVFQTSNLSEVIAATSPDQDGIRYEYRRGDKACVKLFYDTNYRIAAADPGIGFIKDTVVKDEICGLPLECNRDMRYGWTMEKILPTIRVSPTVRPTNTPIPTQVPTLTPSPTIVAATPLPIGGGALPTTTPTGVSSCPLNPVDQPDRCKPVITNVYTKTSATARVEWSPLDPRCEKDSYTVEITGPIEGQTGTQILCQKTGILDEDTDCRLSALARLKNFVDGVEYSVTVKAVKSTSTVCESSSTAQSFRRGTPPTPTPNPEEERSNIITTPSPPPPIAENPRDGRAVGTGPCSIRNLSTYVPNEIVDRERYLRARNASCVCQRESGSNPFSVSRLSCIKGTGTEYSVGLFQINLQFGSRCPAGDNGLLRNGKSCQVVNERIFNACREYFFSSNNNIKYAKGLSVDMSQWRHWSTKKACGL